MLSVGTITVNSAFNCTSVAAYARQYCFTARRLDKMTSNLNAMIV